MNRAMGRSAFGQLFGAPRPERAIVIPVNVSKPVITGTAQVGTTLTTSNGVWSHVPVFFAYQWYADNVAIGGATHKTYVPVAGNVAAVLTVKVTPSNAAGSGVAEASLGTSAVLPLLPSNTVVPTITGTAQVGATLTAHNGTWANGVDSYAYQWTADAVNIALATASTYVPLIGDIGKLIRVKVTATNAAGAVTATSSPTSAVIAA